jgi:hypothetical protein
VVRKKRVILWAGILVLGLVAGLYPVISKKLKTPRVTWYLEAPAGTEIRAASPNGRFFVAGGSNKVYRVKDGETAWTLLPSPFQGGQVLVSDPGTVMLQRARWVGRDLAADWYWFRVGEKGVRIDPKTWYSPQEFLEGSDDWIGVYGDSNEKVGVFDLAGVLKRPIVSPVETLVRAEEDDEGFNLYHGTDTNLRHRGQWAFYPIDFRKRRSFARIGERFEERKTPAFPAIADAASYDGRWVALDDLTESRVYQDGVLKERQIYMQPPSGTGLIAIRDLFNQYVLRQPKANVTWADVVTGFNLDGRRRVGGMRANQTGQGYIQDGADRFSASDLGIPVKEEENRPSFEYISADGRRILGSHAFGKPTYVFAIDR